VHDDVTILSCTSSSSSSFSSCSTITHNQSINQSTNGLDEGMIDKSCAILNEISIKASLSHKCVAQHESCSLSHQSLYQSQSSSLSNTNTNTNTNTKTKRRRFKNDDEDQEEARGRCCSLFLHRLVLVASCCSLLACLLACLLGVSLVSRVSCLV